MPEPSITLPERFPVIAGPTAGGKSALAYAIVRQMRERGIECEIVSADAFQIYRRMDIGTAKPSREEQALVRHHLIDIVDPVADARPFTVSDWLVRAEGAIADIRARARIPIVVGGTHLYVKALLEGLFEGPEPDPALRAALQARPLAHLRAELERVDPRAAARIHANDARRTVRALEVFHQGGVPISTLQAQWDAGRARHDCVLVGLDWPIEALNRRINARVMEMMERGLLEETRGLLERGAFASPSRREGQGVGCFGAAASAQAPDESNICPPPSPPSGRGVQRQAAEALGYKQLLEHLRGECTLEEAVERIKIETRRFAKNQRTWLKRLKTTPGSVWLTASAECAVMHLTEWSTLVAHAIYARDPGASM